MDETINGTELSRRLRSSVAIALAYAIVALPLLVAGRAHGATAMLWAGNGLLLGWLLRRDASAAPSALVLCLLADVVARLMSGAFPLTSIGLAVADLIEVAVAWVLLQQWRRHHADAAAERSVPVALGIGALVAPALGAAIAASWLYLFADARWNDTFFPWWLGHAFGLLAITPVVLAWDRAQWHRLIAGDRAKTFWAAATADPSLHAPAGSFTRERAGASR